MTTALNDILRRIGRSAGSTNVPQVRPCERFRLPHCRNDDIYCVGSTLAILRVWYLSDRVPNRGRHDCTAHNPSEGWDPCKMQLVLPGYLEATTSRLDQHGHFFDAQREPFSLIAAKGMYFEVVQSAAFGCELAMKTLYSVVNPDAKPRIYHRKMRHDLLKAWDRLDGEHGWLVTALNSMPVFMPMNVTADTVRERLRLTRHSFETVRYIGTSGAYPNETSFEPWMHIALAWCAYLRSCELLST